MTPNNLEELPVCPVMTCTSFCPFPETGILPCAKHGTIMVPLSQAPLKKRIYRYFKQKFAGYKYATHKRSIK